MGYWAAVIINNRIENSIRLEKIIFGYQFFINVWFMIVSLYFEIFTTYIPAGKLLKSKLFPVFEITIVPILFATVIWYSSNCLFGIGFMGQSGSTDFKIV